MQAIRDFGGWVTRCLEDFVNGKQGYPPTHDITDAANNAFYVYRKLRFLRDTIEREYPHHIDVVRLADEVLQAFRDDHGGDFPHNVLGSWDKKRFRVTDEQIFTGPKEKESMLEVWERWKDLDRLGQKFPPLYLSKEDNFVHTWNSYLSEAHILQLKQFLRDWLQKRKDGEVY